jgi:hypothetical protein
MRGGVALSHCQVPANNSGLALWQHRFLGASPELRQNILAADERHD